MHHTHATPMLRAPDALSTGFIPDFGDTTTTAGEDCLQHGDVINLPLTCDGYNILPVTVRSEPVHSPLEYTKFTAVVVLIPVNPVKSADVFNHRFEVHGLKTVPLDTSESLVFTLSETDPRSKYISYNPETAHISLQVVLDPWPDEHELDEKDVDEAGIFIRDCIDSSMGKDSAFMKDVWNRYESDPNPEGVLVVDGVVPQNLVNDLNRLISKLADAEPVDWHPGSNDCVRDLVHPSLYPFVNGESQLTEEGQKVLAKIETNRAAGDAVSTGEYGGQYPGLVGSQSSMERPVIHAGVKDRWGRQYEDSVYQWLPAVFKTSLDGTVTIDSYINNLDKRKHDNLYTALAKLFEHFLPMFEQAYAYAKAIKFATGEERVVGHPEDDHGYKPDIEKSSLKGKSLRVITKIVDYTLRDDSAFVDGAFHVEGMSSDHIIATGSYTLSRDDGIEGGELIMRRAFLQTEACKLVRLMPQARHWKADEIVNIGIRPLGKVPTKEGRLIVFPNSHIHKLTRISCGKGWKDCHRRVVVFWLVDPDGDVITSEHVPLQQGAQMSRERALWHRLELMKERSKYKGKFNAERKIHLCEH